MNKKILGIRLGTLLTILGCLMAALVIWVLAKYRSEISDSNETAAMIISGLLFRG